MLVLRRFSRHVGEGLVLFIHALSHLLLIFKSSLLLCQNVWMSSYKHDTQRDWQDRCCCFLPHCGAISVQFTAHPRSVSIGLFEEFQRNHVDTTNTGIWSKKYERLKKKIIANTSQKRKINNTTKQYASVRKQQTIETKQHPHYSKLFSSSQVHLFKLFQLGSGFSQSTVTIFRGFTCFLFPSTDW